MGTLPLSRSHDEAEQPGSREALLLALGHVAEATGLEAGRASSQGA